MLDYKELVTKDRVRFVKYGRGGVIITFEEGLRKSIHEIIRERHSGECQEVVGMEFTEDGYVIIEFSESKSLNHRFDGRVTFKGKIPLGQISFEFIGGHVEERDGLHFPIPR